MRSVSLRGDYQEVYLTERQNDRGTGSDRQAVRQTQPNLYLHMAETLTLMLLSDCLTYQDLFSLQDVLLRQLSSRAPSIHRVANQISIH